MTREEFYKSDRKERDMYLNSQLDHDVYVPLTKDGFEALSERVTNENELILDDPIRSLIAGYLHHVPNDQVTFKMEHLCAVVFKGLSNNMTYSVDQECKQRAIDAAKPKEASNVLPIKKEDNSNGPQGAG